AGETFDYVWKIVRDTSFDPAFDSAKWDRVGTELRPKAIAASTPGELRKVLRDMLGRIGLSHFAVIAGSPDAPGEHHSGSAEPGLDVRVVDGQLVVSKVESGGAAAAAGVQTGWIIDTIDGTSGSNLLAEIADGTPSRLAQLEAWRLAQTRLRGDSGTKVDV